MFHRTLQSVMSSDLKLSDKSFHLLCLSFPISKTGAMTAHNSYKNYSGSREAQSQGLKASNWLFQLLSLPVGLLDVTGRE